ncbi:hypothetical protein FKM82_017209 [Ascaphus truei]
MSQKDKELCIRSCIQSEPLQYTSVLPQRRTAFGAVEGQLKGISRSLMFGDVNADLFQSETHQPFIPCTQFSISICP